jgi:hypothetical protein
VHDPDLARGPALQLAELALEDDVLFVAAAIEKQQLRVEVAEENLPCHRAEGGDPRAAGQADDLPAVAQWLVVEETDGAGALHLCTDLPGAPDVIGVEAPFDPADGDLVEAIRPRGLEGSRGDRVGPADARSIEVRLETQVLPGAEARQCLGFRTRSRSEPERPRRLGLVPDLGDGQVEPRRVDLPRQLVHRMHRQRLGGGPGEALPSLAGQPAKGQQVEDAPSDADFHRLIPPPPPSLHTSAAPRPDPT